MEDKKVRVRDIDICYRTTGEGFPLVMIMGLTANMDWWDPEFIDALSKKYHVVLFDNRGAGRTQAPPGQFSIKQFADDTAGLMDALGIELAHILGVSMGGMIAQELALNYPEKVKKLVLCVTFCGGEKTVYASREVLEKLTDLSGSLEERVKRFSTLLFPEEWLLQHPEYLDDFMKRYMIAPTSDQNAARQFMATTTFNTYERLPQIKCPTLVACGSEDVLIPPENSRIIAERIPGSRLVEFKGAGHGFINQCRREFLEILFDFLE